ncbi:MAG: helix-turn-helix transcriptional regulator [Candidatus Omnitrophota bacterium]
MSIGEAIKTLRVKRKIRQQQLATKVEISQGYLSLVEKGEREPGMDLISKIANYLKVPPQLIFLMACNEQSNVKNFRKPIRNIISAVDEILQRI